MTEITTNSIEKSDFGNQKTEKIKVSHTKSCHFMISQHEALRRATLLKHRKVSTQLKIMAEKEKKKRSAKTSLNQFQLMVDFIEKHPEMINLTKSSYYTNTLREKAWDDLAGILNADGSGPTKKVADWKRTWTDYKSSVKGKAADIERKRVKTGGGSPPEVLSPLQEKVASIIGRILIVGDEKIPETSRASIIEAPESQGIKPTSSEATDCILEAEILDREENDQIECSVGSEINDLNNVVQEIDALSTFNTPVSGQKPKKRTLDEEQAPLSDKTNKKPRKHRKKEDEDEDDEDLESLTAAENRKADALVGIGLSINKVGQSIDKLALAMNQKNTIENARNDLLSNCHIS